MAVWSIVTLGRFPGAFRMDPQFWQPEYIAVEGALRKLPCEPLGELVSTLRKGVFDLPAAEYVETGVPFYRSANVGQILPTDTDLVYISEKRDEAEHKTSLKRGDLMIAKTGKEAASIVLRPRCNVSQDVIALRIKRDRINPFYLAVFLNTRAGFAQMQRWFQGQSQMHLSLPDTRQILVPLISDKDQERVEGVVIKAYAALQRATTRYAEAEQLLSDALGLDALDLSPKLAYTTNFSATLEAARLDPQFFQPKFGLLLSRLGALKSPMLGSLLSEPVLKGVTPDYVEDGEIPLLNSQHLGPTLLDIGSADRTTRAFWAAHRKANLRCNDVLVYATGAYVGRTNVLLDDVEALAGLHVLIVRPDPNKLDPLYAAVVLNSAVGLMQTDKWATGSAQRDLYPKHIERFLVPILNRNMQTRISAKVREAHEARAEAAHLLEDAKGVVEALVLGDGPPKRK